MIIRQVSIFSLPSEPTPLESLVIEGLKNGEWKLHGNFDIEVRDAFAVFIYASSEGPTDYHQMKINTIKGVRNSISGPRNKVYLPFIPKDDGDTMFTLMYGPDLNGVPTTFSEDLQHLLKVPEKLDRIFDIERIEKLRVMIISGGGLVSMTDSHKDMIKSVLCNSVTGLVPLDYMGINQDLSMYKKSTLEHIANDYIEDFVFGSRRWETTGVSKDFLLAKNRSLIISDKLPLCQTVEFMDYWPYEVFVFEMGVIGALGNRHKHFPGISFYVPVLTDTPVQLEFMKKGMCKSVLSNFYASHFGLFHRTLKGWDKTDQQYEDMLGASKLMNHVQSYIDSIGCSGSPLVQGFMRSSHAFTNEAPITYTSGYCVSNASVPSNKILTIRDLRAEEEKGNDLYLFQVGFFNYGLPGTVPGHPLNAESGRQEQILQETLRAMHLMLNNSIVSVSNGWTLTEKTTFMKLTAACGECGVMISVRSLPTQTKNQLKKWRTRNMAYNNEIILKSWLYMPSNVAFVVISDTTAKEEVNNLKTLCTGMGCPFSFLGKLNDRRNELAIYARNEQDEFLALPIKKYLPKRVYPQVDHDFFVSPTTYLAYLGDGVEAMDIENFTEDLLMQVLRHPTTGSKQYIIYHVDRCGNGRVAQQPGVGPFDVPISDYSIIVNNLVADASKARGEARNSYWNEESDKMEVLVGATLENQPDKTLALETIYNLGLTAKPHPKRMRSSDRYRLANCSAIGEQNTIFQYNSVLGARYAITESLLNLILGPITELKMVIVGASVSYARVLSYKRELQTLFERCKAFCDKLGVNFQVDACTSNVQAKQVRSFVASANCPCRVPCQKITPVLKKPGNTLLHLAVSEEVTLLGSVYHEVTGQTMDQTAELNPLALLRLLQFVMELKDEGVVAAGHDISDGGIFACVAEMIIAGKCAATLNLPPHMDPATFLLSETPGLILEVPPEKGFEIVSRASERNVFCKILGKVTQGDAMQINHGENTLFEINVKKLGNNWRFFSNKQDLLFVNEGQDLLSEEGYGDYEMHLTTLPYVLNSKMRIASAVMVYLLPGCGAPDALLAALTESGFKVDFKVATGRHYPRNPLQLDEYETSMSYLTMGVIVYGSCNVSDRDAGDKGIVQWMRRNRDVIDEIYRVMSRPWVFSLGIGQMAARVLLASRSVCYDQETHTPPTLAKNASGRFESRWVNIKIPEDTKAIAFKDLQGCLLPCWVQGTSLGFDHHNDQFMASLKAEKKMVASEFHNPSLDAGPATTYPLNPTESKYPYAGLCSSDGKHLALLHDPCLAFFDWQWQHIPANCSGSRTAPVSPWKLMFYRLHLWALAMQHYALESGQYHDANETVQRPTNASSFPDDERRGAIGPDAHYQPREDLDPNLQ